MIVVDSSVWISYFKNRPVGIAELLSQAINSGEDLAIIPMILSEVLSGFKQDQDYKDAFKVLTQVPNLPLTVETHIEAAQMYRHLRKKGITVRGVVDCLIAQVCINTRSPLLTLDKDFKRIANYTSLSLFA